MKRFNINEKVTPNRIPSEDPRLAGLKDAVYEPHERVLKRGANWMIVAQDNGKGKRSYYLEHIYSGQKVNNISELSAQAGYNEITKAFTEIESRPQQYQTQAQQQPNPVPGQPKTPEQEHSEWFKQRAAELDQGFAEMTNKMNARNAEIDEELMRQKLASLRESMSSVERIMSKLDPQPVEPETPPSDGNGDGTEE